MVGIIDDTHLRYPVGSRIRVAENSGTVKYVGEVAGYPNIWLGIEWDDPRRGKHNGSVDGRHYFHTYHPTAGSFIRPGKVGPFQSVEEAVRQRYSGYSTQGVDNELIKQTQQSLQASIFEVVGMDKIARKQSKFEQLEELSVSGSSVNSAGFLKDFTALTTLNLSHTLIWNWSIMADVCRQVPTLVNLNLSSNRLQLPSSEAQIAELEPYLRQLRHVNLSNCGFSKWADVAWTARLWPNILTLSLQDNPIGELSEVNCKEIFKNIRELDLHCTKIMDFDQVCKLGNVHTLQILNLMENGIEEVKLPDCEPNEKLNIFPSLEQLNLLHNPIWNETDAFNELDKLAKLKRLSKTPCMKSDFNEMFVKAVASITQLEVINKAEIRPEDRRGAEYEIWKKYANEWSLASKSPEALREFYKKHRSYATLVKKYGPPSDFVTSNITEAKISKLIKIRIKNTYNNGQIWEKKVPRLITVQTLLGLIIKYFHMEPQANAIRLSYVDGKHPDLVVPMDNMSKTLDFYSLQENDTVLVECDI